MKGHHLHRAGILVSTALLKETRKADTLDGNVEDGNGEITEH